MNYSFVPLFITALFVRVMLLWYLGHTHSIAHIAFLLGDILIGVLIFVIATKMNLARPRYLMNVFLFNPLSIFILISENFLQYFVNRKNIVSQEAANFWNILYGNHEVLDTLRVSGFPIYIIGILISLAFVWLAALWYLEKRTFPRILFLLSFGFLTLFLFLTRVTPFDMYFLIPFFLLLTGYDKRFNKVSLTLFVVGIISGSAYIVAFLDHQLYHMVVIRVLSLATFLTFVWMYFYGRQIVVHNEIVFSALEKTRTSLSKSTRKTKKSTRPKPQKKKRNAKKHKK